MQRLLNLNNYLHPPVRKDQQTLEIEESVEMMTQRRNYTRSYEVFQAWRNQCQRPMRSPGFSIHLDPSVKYLLNTKGTIECTLSETPRTERLDAVSMVSDRCRLRVLSRYFNAWKL